MNWTHGLHQVEEDGDEDDDNDDHHRRHRDYEPEEDDDNESLVESGSTSAGEFRSCTFCSITAAKLSKIDYEAMPSFRETIDRIDGARRELCGKQEEEEWSGMISCSVLENNAQNFAGDK
ncbi:uncharacterized protein LOC143183687 [Calliopsis andreniformis]|uniref:uncharacterized protein LOC143183687 n=1 Tax=Calliopsis andreniformis TaxID=337506 RepID=UPI003FCCC14E